MFGSANKASGAALRFFSLSSDRRGTMSVLAADGLPRAPREEQGGEVGKGAIYVPCNFTLRNVTVGVEFIVKENV